jgi:membrane protein EpsK
VFSQFLWINGANTLGLLIRVAVTVGLFLLLPARLWYFGGGTLIGALIPLALFIVMWRRLTPQLSIQFQAFDRKRLFVLLGMGGWVIVNTAGAMLLSRVDLIVVNAFFGAALTGAYGSVAQLSTLMDSVVNAISSVLRPVMLIKFSQGDIEGLKRVSMISVKLLGFALALPAGLLCGFAKPVLTLWLGPSFEGLSLLVIILVFHFSINYSVRPLLYVQNAYNKVRWPGIATFIAGILDLILAILIARWGKWGYIGIAAVGVLVWTLKNTVYMPLYTAHIMHCPWWTFYPSLLPSLFYTAFVGLTSFGLTLLHSPEHFLALLGDMLLISLLYGGLVWRLGLKAEERSLVLEVTPLKFLNTQK